MILDNQYQLWQLINVLFKKNEIKALNGFKEPMVMISVTEATG